MFASERVQQTKLGRGQRGVDAVDIRLHLVRVDAQPGHLDQISSRCDRLTGSPAGRRLNPCDEFLHRERFDEIVVGADLKRMHPVVLGAACAHHDDRNADPLAAGGLDQPPPVDSRQHQIEHADVGSLEAQSRESGLTFAHPRRVKSGCGQVADHALADKLVVFNYEYLAHVTTLWSNSWVERVIDGKISGERMVTGGEQSLGSLRGRLLIEESREVVVLLDADDRVIHASRRARETYPDVAHGRRLPGPMRDGRRPTEILEVPLIVGDRVERLVYIGRPGDMHAYEELRAGFTAAVSHELRTPLARLLALIESIELPGADVDELIDLARGQIDQMGELIDDVLFLGELETGHAVVGLGSSRVLQIFREVVGEFAERTEVAGLAVTVTGDEEVEIAVRPRMLQVLARNFIENAIRYAGPDCTLELDVRRRRGWVQVRARDTGLGTPPEALPRLFERFYRADPARSSRGTGLGLAIVKHICTSAGGYAVAENSEPHGLTIRLMFPEGDSAGLMDG